MPNIPVFPLAATNREHNSAVQRLNAALLKQDRMGERLEAALGTSVELGAYARLQAAGEQVAAREAWVNWVDDESYRGLNAGPFELRADSETTTSADVYPPARSEDRPMKRTRAQLPRHELLGMDPEPLGSERYRRLVARSDTHPESPGVR